MPASKEYEPKLNRSTPPAGSVPTVASSNPSNTDAQPFHKDVAPTDAATLIPKTISANISLEENAPTAQSAITGVAEIMRTAEAMPPIAEHKTAAPTARPASPRWVIG